jgi:hypothetical protein
METSTMDENKCREALIKCNFDEDLALESLL